MTPVELKTVLKDLGLTQLEFAAEIQANKSTISRWMTGEVPIPGRIPLAVDGLRWRALMKMLVERELKAREAKPETYSTA